ncbi:TRAP transporter small permease [Sporosarcina pasteurii]|uniref:2,3-diketo-L-gulonate TRAP transporter small permease protein YiaM n=1 Tax=Sporosarcina pasteurii TaxID=1474 RepID=A0A380BYJ7_SPOPA|nr:TRAP transporter small permease subunit [Sporosarcina pasteurii]MDS9471400.1 TRAP transporter small permease subunit [Sporosarcina pasteurii]QBQ04974.1 TRAP transporter small permease [Sporosarcina pasteurii]SUJ08860.1 2,3-diketo-L-gulonate TRAP transporter small permease protein YiaM [Sporosarcina pasteurii]
MSLFKIVSDSLFKLEKVIVIILLPILLFSLFADVLFRYALNSPLLWAQEISLFTFIFASFIGASMSVKVKEAVAVTILVDRIPVSLRNILIITGLLTSLLFTLLLVYLSIKWISNPTILYQKSVTTQIPMIIPYLSIPIGMFFMVIHFVHLFMDSLRQAKEKKVIE